ncbi:HNH endonuclease [Amycolatopsis sp. cmx-11-51]|uniref:HNH endonuclease n=1 Tax=Amycolatopsis sp. cmx-11-51 TaxID=2785797 RepID=UPI0039E57DAA
MGTTDKTRKILWGRAGNRCADCRRELITHRTADGDEEAIVGDEAHIEAKSPGGPRYGKGDPASLDHYDNLILLCRVDHKKIDDQPCYYTVDRLLKLKADHEAWVNHALDERVTLPGGVLVETNRQTYVLTVYRGFRLALDIWEARIDAVIDANVITPNPTELQQLHDHCAQAWRNSYVACGHLTAATTAECADAAERVLARWKSLADDAVDGLLPSTHPGADPHDDIFNTEDELLELLSAATGMTPSTVRNSAPLTGRLGGTGKRY